QAVTTAKNSARNGQVSERELWQAVLLRAVEDALDAPSLGAKESRRQRAMQEARDYLTRPSRDLAMVCSLAGMDMQAVIEGMQKRVAMAPSEGIRHGMKKRALTITHAGETLTYREWAERTGLTWFTIRERLNKGWPVEE